MPNKPNTPTNAKHKLFCKEYLVDLNATQAYIRAGYSAKTAEVCASRLLRNAKVKAEIKGLMSKREKKVEISAEYVLTSIKEVLEECRKAENKENQSLKALELLGRHLKLFVDKVEVEDVTPNVVTIIRPPPRKKPKKRG